VTVRSVGERVAIGWLGSACGACRHCIGGWAPAETVAVFGIGGLGHLALQYARIAGGFTIAVDVQDDKLAMARELGADEVVNAATTDPVRAIQALGGADVAVAPAASPQSFDQAYRSLRRGGGEVVDSYTGRTDAWAVTVTDGVVDLRRPVAMPQEAPAADSADEHAAVDAETVRTLARTVPGVVAVRLHPDARPSA
jgi:D-arabinose 1-dehydrogenase-like Zn-dependent alcohol dehydrogenase